MTRSQFIRQLRFSLALRFAPGQAAEIVNDYEEYFDAGLAQGRTEEELCAEFGPPAGIVQTLLCERPRGAFSHWIGRENGAAVLLAILSAALVFSLLYVQHRRYLYGVNAAAAALCVLLPLLQALLLHFWGNRAEQPRQRRTWAALRAAALALFALTIALLFAFVHGLEHPGSAGLLFELISPPSSGPFFDRLTILCAAGAVLLWCADLLHAGPRTRLPLLLCDAGLAFGALGVDRLLGGFDTIDHFPLLLLRFAGPMPLGLALAAFSALILGERGRRMRNAQTSS